MKTAITLSPSTFKRRIRIAFLLVTLPPCLVAQAEVTMEEVGTPTWEPTSAFIASLEFPHTTDLSPRQKERLLFSQVLGDSYVIQDNFEFGYLPVDKDNGPHDREFQVAVAAFGGIDTDVVQTSDVREPSSMFRGITLVPSDDAPDGRSFPHGDEVPVIPNDIFPITVTYAQETHNGNVVISSEDVEIPALTKYGVITDLDGNQRDYTGFNWTRIHFPWGAFWPGDKSLSGIPGNYEGVFRYRDKENNGWDVTFSYSAKRPTGVAGDLDYNQFLDWDDLDVLTHNVALGSTNDRLDLNNDGNVDVDDVHFWVTDLALTLVGDSNLDGKVNFEDFLDLSDNFGKPGSWEHGDFNADGLVDFGDFLLLSDNYGNSSPISSAVPEPPGFGLTLFGLVATMGFRRRLTRRRITAAPTAASALALRTRPGQLIVVA